MNGSSNNGMVTVVDAFLSTVQVRAEAPAIRLANLSTALTWGEYGVAARRAATGLARLGLARGDSLGLLLSNRPEFHVADAAGLLLGATSFSMYNTSAPEQLAHVIRDAGCRIFITEPALVGRLGEGLTLSGCAVEEVIVVDTPSWTDVLSNSELAHPAEISGDDIATLIYTSGTTGPPKAVQLTHHNIVAMTHEVGDILGLQPDFRAISALPMAHVAERTCTHYMPMTVGHSVVCCPDYADVTKLLPLVEPEVFFSPPRLWEKLRATTADAVANGADHVALRRQMGLGRTHIALTGAAPCPPAVIDFFNSIGVPLRQLYGLSETTGVVSIAAGSTSDSVGPPLPSTEVRLLEDGELLVRGPLVMAGYRNLPEATAAAIDADGWLHTGDVATLGSDGELRIVDRKKELIINASGKNMSPTNIEARLKEASPLIGQACVIGDGRPYNVALIVVDPALAAGFSHGEQVRAEVADALTRANARLARVEQIKRYVVLPDEWLPDSDELTPTMKLKRRPIAEKFAKQIDALYDDVAQQPAASVLIQ